LTKKSLKYDNTKKEKCLSLESIQDLEAKIDLLIGGYHTVKAELETVKTENNEKAVTISALTEENLNLRKELQSLKELTDTQQSNVNTAAGKIQELIAKLEQVA
jgi:FtsZ-binding cell division protein ZapB